MYDEDFDEEFQESKADKLKKLYLIKVFKEYGFAYGIVLLCVTLGYVMVLLPATIKWGYTSTRDLIVWLSKGDVAVEEFYWFVFYLSWSVVITVWLTNKICDFVIKRKGRIKNKLNSNNIGL